MSDSDKEIYSDGRELGKWESIYPREAKRCICLEVVVLLIYLILGVGMIIYSSYMLSLPEDPFPWFELLGLSAAGCVGATIFSMKWLVHSVAKKMWHADRIFWRLLVPIMGGFYAFIILILLNSNLSDLGYESSMTSDVHKYRLAFAFIIGFAADRIGGWLTNIAKSAFGLTS